MRRYFIHFLISVLLLAGGLAGFNWLADPYAIYRDREAMLQLPGPILVMNERVFKTVGLAKTRSDIVMLGTSRTDIGIGREHSVFEGRRVFNLATFGQPIRESRRLMEIAIEQGKPQVVVLGLDFFAFNALMARPTDYVEENYSSSRSYSLMLSVSTLVDSSKALRRKAPSDGDCCYANGFRTAFKSGALAGTYRDNFVATERAYLLKNYLPYPQCRYSFDGAGSSTMDSLREMMRLAHRQHIDFKLFISPAHARLWETLAAAGLWGEWEGWKRQLVRINEEEAARSGAVPFALWDFSGYDDISTETVPAASDRSSLMHWYSDSAHYTPVLGKRIIRRIFAVDEQEGGWGVTLDSAGIDVHLASLRIARDRYRESHHQDLAEIDESAKVVNSLKQCHDNK